jgi:hypothetical protein
VGCYGPSYFVTVSEIPSPREDCDEDPAAVAAMLTSAHPTWDADALAWGILHHTRAYVPDETRHQLAAEALSATPSS